MHRSMRRIGAPNAKNIGNGPGEYTFDDTRLGTGNKYEPQEESIRFLEGPAQTMAGRLAQTVNDLPVDVCTDRCKGAKHRTSTT